MERLTRYDAQGEACPNHDDNYFVGYNAITNRLAKYEDLGYTPEQLKRMIETCDAQSRFARERWGGLACEHYLGGGGCECDNTNTVCDSGDCDAFVLDIDWIAHYG